MKWSKMILILTTVLLMASCSSDAQHKLREKVAELPTMPNSVVLSEVWKQTHGADSRCDGYMVSRLYGTNEPIETIIAFVEQEIVSKEKWEEDPRIPNDPQNVAVYREDGFHLSVGPTTLRTDPLFPHKDVTLEREYSTLYIVVVTYGDPELRGECWDY